MNVELPHTAVTHLIAEFDGLINGWPECRMPNLVQNTSFNIQSIRDNMKERTQRLLGSLMLNSSRSWKTELSALISLS